MLALYESTECYNEVPKESNKKDIWIHMGNRLLDIKKEISSLFLGNEQLASQLAQIVDETECFVRSYERPGVVKRWKRINFRLLFFKCSFDLIEESPEMYREISWGFNELKLSFYPDKELIEARKQYFRQAKQKIEERISINCMGDLSSLVSCPMFATIFSRIKL